MRYSCSWRMDWEIGIFFRSTTEAILIESLELKNLMNRTTGEKQYTMEHQDWTTVVLKRRNPKDSKPAVDSEKIRLAKLEQTDDYTPPKKRVSGESIQALIRKRMELGLTQEKADQKCSFSKNTFKDIESHKSLPNQAQQSALQRHFGVQLKIDHI